MKQPRSGPQMRRLIAVLGAAMFTDAMLFGVLAPLLPTYVDDLDLSKSEAGVLTGAMGAGLFLSALPTAALANRIGARRAVLVGLGLLVAASAAFATAGSVELMITSRFLQGVSGALIWAGGLTWIAGVAEPSRRGAAIGTLIGIGIAGTVAGPLAGSLALATSPDLVFGAVPVAGLALIVLIYPLAQRGAARPSAGLARLWSHPAARTVALVNLWFLVLPATVLGLIGVLGPLRLDDLGAAAGLIGFVFLSAGGIEAAMNAAGGRLADRVGTVPLLRAGMVAIGVTIGLFALVDGLAVTALVIVAAAVGMGLFGAPVNISLQAILEEAGVGDAHAFGFYNLGFSGGYLLGATGGAALADVGGDFLPCALLFAGTLITAPFANMTATRAKSAPAATTVPAISSASGDRGQR
jgi:predicted MFS family arabinose efflux permease